MSLKSADVHAVSLRLAELGEALNGYGDIWLSYAYQYNSLINTDLEGETTKSLSILHQSMLDYLAVIVKTLEDRLHTLKHHTLPENTSYEIKSTYKSNAAYGLTPTSSVRKQC